jgi:hypothetical protein
MSETGPFSTDSAGVVGWLASRFSPKAPESGQPKTLCLDAHDSNSQTLGGGENEGKDFLKTRPVFMAPLQAADCFGTAVRNWQVCGSGSETSASQKPHSSVE